MLRSWHCFQGPYELGSYSYAYGCIPRCQRKFHWAEFWILACSWHHLSPRRKALNQVMSTPSPCATQLLLQVVNLTLHVSFILCMGDMALPSRLTLTSMCCLHTSFMISPLLWVYDWIITLKAPWFLLVRINIILMWPDRRLVRTWLFHFQH